MARIVIVATAVIVCGYLMQCGVIPASTTTKLTIEQREWVEAGLELYICGKVRDEGMSCPPDKLELFWPELGPVEMTLRWY